MLYGTFRVRGLPQNVRELEETELYVLKSTTQIYRYYFFDPYFDTSLEAITVAAAYFPSGDKRCSFVLRVHLYLEPAHLGAYVI